MEKFIKKSIINRNNIDLTIDKEEVIRYLGYNSKDVDKLTDKIIDNCLVELLKIAKTNYIYIIFEIKREKRNIFLNDLNFKLEGKDIFNHLKGSKKCVVIALTLGYEVDRRIKYYSKIDLTKSLIFDACATAAIEALSDRVKAIIKRISVNSGYNTTNRYSPGYGDFPIKTQKKIIDFLDAKYHIGLTVTDSNILIPRKSVTALIGVGKQIQTEKIGCEACRLYKTCLYLKKGDICET